jgi:hypothetical protein
MERQIHFHVEEPSMEAFLDGIVPRMMNGVEFKIINHESKPQLLKNIPLRFRGYLMMPPEVRPKSVVLIDRDSDNCLELKGKLEKICQDLGIFTKTHPTPEGLFDVANKIVIEELEA